MTSPTDFQISCTEPSSLHQGVSLMVPGHGQSGHPQGSCYHYQSLLKSITWNIRQTLDLETVWQQTLQGLGQVFNASRCYGCSYQEGATQVTIVAEYNQSGPEFPLANSLALAEHPYLSQAATTLKPVLTQQPLLQAQGEGLAQPEMSLLTVATYYQDQPNGLIVVQKLSGHWSEPEAEFLQELAEQVGTAIAHATLFAESQAMGATLRRVNQNLLEQHRVTEEAHKKAEEASRLKSEFLANTSHELRTPLNGMLGFLKLIIDGMADDPQEQMEFIQEAYRSALHLLNVINDILDIAKIEAGKMQLELSPVSLDGLLAQVKDFTQPQAVHKNLGFHIIPLGLRDQVILYGNYQRLLQVMLNLVGNAIKFTHEGEVTISTEILKRKVVVHNQELPGLVTVRVADTGIGVSLEKQDKLFQSFSQVDASRTRQYGGTGLGLAISQKLVEAMGGVVHFYSMGEGLGSTVTFTVPLYQEPVL